jgi:hypothetical protein
MPVYDPVAYWHGSPTPDIARYNVGWMRNDTPLGGGTVDRTLEGDYSGYMRRFSDDNPDVALAVGDVVGFSVVAEDSLSQPAPGQAVLITIPDPELVVEPRGPTRLHLAL